MPEYLNTTSFEEGKIKKRGGVGELLKGNGSGFDKYEELIESVKEKAKAEGKTVIANEKIAGERVFIIRTTETIKDITLNSLGDKFIGDFGCNIEMYLEECGIENKGNLVSELKPDEVLIFTAHESEGIPSCYFSWTEPDGTTIYNTVSYDGSGEFYTYE